MDAYVPMGSMSFVFVCLPGKELEPRIIINIDADNIWYLTCPEDWQQPEPLECLEPHETRGRCDRPLST